MSVGVHSSGITTSLEIERLFIEERVLDEPGRRSPARREDAKGAQLDHRAVWVLIVLGVAISIAILLLGTRVPCDCPPPRKEAIVSRRCTVDRHVLVRVVISGMGATAGAVLLATTRRQREAR